MAASTLLHMTTTRPGQAMFAFEHAQYHRAYVAGMELANRFTKVPNLLDPIQNMGQRASKWQLDHQQSHNVVMSMLPILYGEVPSQLHIGNNMMDTNLENAPEKTWWDFVNHHEHYITNLVMPTPSGNFPILP